MFGARIDRMLLGAFAVAVGMAHDGRASEIGDSGAKFEIDLGPVERFSSEASAAAACRPDGVVWADRKTGYFYPKFSREYGASKYGAFTCYKQAVEADYWGWGVISNVGGHKGREFPDKFPCATCM